MNEASSAPGFLRICAAAFAVIMMSVFVWYSHVRAQPAELQAAMLEEGSLNEPPFSGLVPQTPSLLMVTSKSGMIILPPMWGTRGPGPNSKLERGSGVLVLFPKRSGDFTSSVFSKRTPENFQCEKLKTEISAVSALAGEEVPNPFRVADSTSELIPFPDLPEFESHRIYVEKEVKPMLMSTSKSGLILPPMPIGDQKVRVENFVSEALKHLFHRESAVSAAKP
jgi:hypothetical protein